MFSFVQVLNFQGNRMFFTQQTTRRYNGSLSVRVHTGGNSRESAGRDINDLYSSLKASPSFFNSQPLVHNGSAGVDHSKEELSEENMAKIPTGTVTCRHEVRCGKIYSWGVIKDGVFLRQIILAVSYRLVAVYVFVHISELSHILEFLENS